MNKIFTITMVAFLFVFTLGVALADPNGADTVTPGTSERLTSGVAQSHNATAGNVTELTIYGDSITQSWQGYFGNVSGSIQLADSSGDTMYNWSLASPQGEIFATAVSDSLDFTGVQCFNWTANGTALETTYNINDSADGVNETFNLTDHNSFAVGVTSFNENACMSTRVFDTSGVGVDQTFEEVLLADAAGNPIFTALLEQDVAGFDGATHDFEMLVLEDGHSGDTSTTPYYFYVELE